MTSGAAMPEVYIPLPTPVWLVVMGVAVAFCLISMIASLFKGDDE